MKHERKLSRPPGRPPKFPGESRVVTMTLPVATLQALAILDADRARAIVRAAELALAGPAANGTATVEIRAGSNGTAVLTVPRSRLLAEIPGLTLIEVSPGRHLVVLEPGVPLAEVEVAITDRLEAVEPDDAEDRVILERVLAQVRLFRRAQRIRIGEVILLDI